MAKDRKYSDVDVEGIPEDEPIFVLRAQDVFAVATLKFYQGLRDSSGDLGGANDLDYTISMFRSWKPKKIPD